ncbi:MAG: acyltransferase [Melioribacteraceae bacterium]|nr:acyltransferase [Melioribacteraceae bacterium]
MAVKQRLYYIDWLRVIAFLLLILYHTGMFFVPWNFHFKNGETSELFELWMVPLNQFRLPLLFIISGMGVYFAINSRNSLGFIKERSTRLLLPLMFGMAVIIPPQIYFERLTQNVQYESYFQFWRTVFDFVPYPEGGSLSWHHLWYILYIFIYSLFTLPLLNYLKRNSSIKLKEKLYSFFSKPGRIYFLGIPVLLIYYSMAPFFPTTHGLIDDWYNLTYSFLFFLYGIIVISVKDMWDILENQRKLSLKIALVPFAFLLLFVWGPTFEIMNEDTVTFFFLYGFLKITFITAFLLTILGYSRKLFNIKNKFIIYATEAVYPFYILHQTIMMIFGYYILQLPLGILPKFTAVVIVTFGGSWLTYEVLIKRFNPMRSLFGIKPLDKNNRLNVISAAEGD